MLDPVPPLWVITFNGNDTRFDVVLPTKIQEKMEQLQKLQRLTSNCNELKSSCIEALNQKDSSTKKVKDVFRFLDKLKELIRLYQRFLSNQPEQDPKDQI
jgi:hypothetical protein